MLIRQFFRAVIGSLVFVVNTQTIDLACQWRTSAHDCNSSATANEHHASALQLNSAADHEPSGNQSKNDCCSAVISCGNALSLSTSSRPFAGSAVKPAPHFMLVALIVSRSLGPEPPPPRA